MTDAKVVQTAGRQCNSDLMPVPHPHKGKGHATNRSNRGFSLFYAGIKGENEANIDVESILLLDQSDLDWKSVAKRHQLPDGYPCALVAFAACLPFEDHIQYFYKQLMLNGLLARNEQGPPGGMSLVGMLKALKTWEQAVKNGRFRSDKLRGMDVHHITLKGSKIVDFAIYPTGLTNSKVDTIIIFLEGDGREGHFFSAKRMRPGQHKRMLQIVAQNNLPEEPAQTQPDVPSSEQWVTVTKRAPTPPTLDSRAVETATWLGLTPAELNIVDSSCGAMGFEPEEKEEEDGATADLTAEAPRVARRDHVRAAGVMFEPLEPYHLRGSLVNATPDELPSYEGTMVVWSPPDPQDPPSPPPEETSPPLEFQPESERIEFIKTNVTVPRFTHALRGYAVGDLLPDGAVGHADASCENGCGATELHPAVQEKYGFTRRSFYYVSANAGVNPLDAKYLTNGQYNPEWLSSMVFGNTSYVLVYAGLFSDCHFFRLKETATIVPKSRKFLPRLFCGLGAPAAGTLLCKGAALLKEAGWRRLGAVGKMSGPIIATAGLAYAAFPDAIPTLKDKLVDTLRGHGLLPEPSATCYHAQKELPTADLSAFDGHRRAEWTVMRQYVREDLVPAFHSLQVRNGDQDIDPEKALEGLQTLKHGLETKRGTRGYRVFGTPGPKNCKSCGKAPPPAGVKYKWKHRVCTDCEKSLNLCGAVTPMGRDIQANCAVADGPPGRVHMYSSTLPPKKKKWEQVEVPPGAITIRASDAPWMAGVRTMAKVLEVTKEDIFKIDTSLEKRRQECVLAGIAISGCYPMVTRKGLYSRMQALLGRAFLKKPESCPKAWKKMEDLKHLILPKGALDGSQMDVDEWIASMPGRRKRALKRAHKQFLEDGLLEDKDLTFSAFVKQELLAAFEEYEGPVSKELEETIARMIMAPQDKAHVVAGPVIKPKLMRLKAHWHHDNWLFYGATTPKKLQRWLDKSVGICADGEVFAFWCDFSMFDCTHNEHSMKLIESYYSEMETCPLFKMIIDAWRVPAGTMGELKFRLHQIMLASGRDDTALMNAMYCGFAMGLAVAAAVRNKSLEDLDSEDILFATAYVRISICGDDTLGFLPKSLWYRRAQIMASIELNLSRFGLVSKLDCSNYLGSAVYLGMRPYNVPTPFGRQWLWGRTIGRAAYKMGWMLDLSKGDAAAWAHGVADSIVRTQPYVPLLSDLARKVVELCQGCKRTPVLADPHKPWTHWTPHENLGQLTYDDQTLHCLVLSYETPTYYGASQPVSPTIHDLHRSVTNIQKIDRLPYNLEDYALQCYCNRDDK